MEAKNSAEGLIEYYKKYLEKIYGERDIRYLSDSFESLLQEYRAWLKRFTYYGTEQWKRGQSFFYKIIDVMMSSLPKKK